MTKKPWSVLLIPNVGETRRKTSFATGVYAQSSGEAETRLMFKEDKSIQSIEIIVLKGKEMYSGLSRMLQREQ